LPFVAPKPLAQCDELSSRKAERNGWPNLYLTPVAHTVITW
jgi:hypothetical protein